MPSAAALAGGDSGVRREGRRRAKGGDMGVKEKGIGKRMLLKMPRKEAATRAQHERAPTTSRPAASHTGCRAGLPLKICTLACAPLKFA